MATQTRVSSRKLNRGKMYRIYYGEVVSVFPFQFNPSEVSEEIGVEYHFTDSVGQYMTSAVFSRYTQNTQSFTLFLDGREFNSKTTRAYKNDVKKQIAHLKLFVQPGPALSEETPQFVGPTVTKIVRGSRVWTGVINTISIKEEMFDRNFDVIRAKVDINFTATSQGFAQELQRLDTIRGRAGLNG